MSNFTYWKLHISIHALREESDRTLCQKYKNFKEFQSTLSVRRATLHLGHCVAVTLISIHALREESDRPRSSSATRACYFNPRSP